jgi:indole-3-glycerol phosphate synthase
MSDILNRIADYKREEVAQRRAQTPLSALEEQIATQSAPRGFAKALVANKQPDSLSLIAEIKKASPSKGLIRPEFDPSALARAYAAGGASCLSILTDAPSFQGHEDHFKAARAAVALPCIRKEFLVDPWQVAESRSIGADSILVIMAMIDDALALDLVQVAKALGMDSLIEVHDAPEMERALLLPSPLIGVNNRNLRTFEVDLAVTETLSGMIGPGHILVAESGIFTRADVERMDRTGATAMLVGESLMRQNDVEMAVKTLLKS